MAIDPKQIERWREWLQPVLRDIEAATPGLADALQGLGSMAAEALPALLAEREEMLAVLGEVEWSGRTLVPRQGAPPMELVGCPACHGEAKPDPTGRLVGHAPDCRLAALLKGTR